MATGPVSHRARRSRQTCATSSASIGARMSGGAPLSLDSAATVRLTQRSSTLSRHQTGARKQESGSASLAVKRVRALDVCAGSRLLCSRGIGQQVRTLSRACTLADFETRPRSVLSRRRVRTALLVIFWKASKPHLAFPSAVIPASPSRRGTTCEGGRRKHDLCRACEYECENIESDRSEETESGVHTWSLATATPGSSLYPPLCR